MDAGNIAVVINKLYTEANYWVILASQNLKSEVVKYIRKKVLSFSSKSSQHT